MATEDSQPFLARQNHQIEIRRQKFVEASLNLKKCVDEKRESEREAFLLDLHKAGTEYFRYVEDSVLDSGGTSGTEFNDWLRDITKTALSVLSATPHFYYRLRQQRNELGLPATAFEPSPGFFHHMQGLIASQRPEDTTRLRDQFAVANLPTDGFDNPYHPTDRKQASASQEIVLLIHGIRTNAPWEEMVRNELQVDPDRIVVPLRYGYFDVVQFLWPFWTRERAIRNIFRRLQAARRKYPREDLSVIAHSFGTYAIAKILYENPDVILHRLILCGSIVPTDFRWDQIFGQLRNEVVNDCGSRDLWPILARSCTWGFGPSGSFGFGNIGVRDRFHNYGHADYFNREFVRTYWRPYFDSNQIISSEWESERKATPWWVSMLSVISVKWIVLLLFLASLVMHFRSRARSDLSMGIVEPTIVEESKSGNETNLTLRFGIGIRSRDGFDHRRAKIQVFFYDAQSDGSVVLTNAQVNYQWLTPYHDWRDTSTEVLAVAYRRSATRSDVERRFFGYIIRVYYDDELKSYRADPTKLLVMFPPVPTAAAIPFRTAERPSPPMTAQPSPTPTATALTAQSPPKITDQITLGEVSRKYALREGREAEQEAFAKGLDGKVIDWKVEVHSCSRHNDTAHLYFRDPSGDSLPPVTLAIFTGDAANRALSLRSGDRIQLRGTLSFQRRDEVNVKDASFEFLERGM